MRGLGRMVFWGVVVFLFVKRALVLRPRETIAALSALISALVNACCGIDSTRAVEHHDESAAFSVITSANYGRPFEERGERDLVGDRQCRERREGDVDPAILDHAQVLGVKPGKFSGILLGQLPLFAELSKPQTETALCTFDWLLKGRAQPDLRRSMISRETLASSHSTGLREVGQDLHKSCLESDQVMSYRRKMGSCTNIGRWDEGKAS